MNFPARSRFMALVFTCLVLVYASFVTVKHFHQNAENHKDCAVCIISLNEQTPLGASNVSIVIATLMFYGAIIIRKDAGIIKPLQYTNNQPNAPPLA